MYGENISRMLEKIKSIDWQQLRVDRGLSHAYLAREFLRRSALWARALNCQEKWPLFDIAAHINPEVINIITNEMETCLEEKYSITYKILLWALHWAALLDLEDTISYNLPAPYEPMLLMYERGGYLSQGTFWEVPMGTFDRSPIDGYLVEEPIVELDEDILDKLDERRTTS